MSSISAIVIDPAVEGRLAIKEVATPQVGASEVLVQVEAISLNRGEAVMAMGAAEGWRPGWDLAGTVIQSAASGTGPQVGSRVVAIVDTGAWAEQVAVPTTRVAEIPDSVTFAQAATLPIAGLTALHALAKGGLLLNRCVLITGSTGGVGLYAHQLARLSGAYVVGTARQPRHEALVREAGADEVVVGEDVSQARAYGPYDLIVESVGGKTFSTVFPLLAAGATCVTFGWSSGISEVTVDVMDLVRTTVGGSIHGLNMYAEFNQRPPSIDLAYLAQLVAKQQLRPSIEVEASWHEINVVAQRLRERQFTGKAVLHLSK
jgi:NADPH:quinone reductase-like Zn-dependent oxidoreductase